MKSKNSLTLIVIFIILSGCESSNYERFKPILEIYPNTKNYRSYLILPPSTCYPCQSESWQTASRILLRYPSIRCIFCTDSYNYGEVEAKCMIDGLQETNYTIDTTIFNQVNLLNDDLGFPLLLALDGERIKKVIVCLSGKQLRETINKMQE